MVIPSSPVVWPRTLGCDLDSEMNEEGDRHGTQRL